ncbi:hypothetical protein [uncultured Dietzia sp.]|uniref:hypothetical protein n=1 Tax=uncultured Dietzia sp. TaxID=395519 RepID=UPI0025FE1BC7|nr:hypothetical protein [uncultured Dietzia sp.]
MADITDVDSSRLRALARTLGTEEQRTAGVTPADALTTIGAALRGSLIAACNGAVAFDTLEFQENIATRFDAEIDALVTAAGVLEDQEWATTAALGLVGPPR